MWTKKPPKTAGWYWWRKDAAHISLPCCVDSEGQMSVHTSPHVAPKADWKGEWWAERILEPVA